MSGAGAWAIGIAAVVAGAVLLVRVLPGADLGDVRLDKLHRRASPNDALAAPAGFTTAKVDVVSPTFDLRAADLRAVFDKVLASERRLEKVASDDEFLHDRYVQRTPLIGFPDTIMVRFVDLGGGRSSIAIYSRSKLGYSDLGANKARIERWLNALSLAAKRGV